MKTLYEKFLASTGVVTDSRLVTPGCMYVALVGETFDGNDFVPQALGQGAAFAVTSRTDVSADEKVVVVEDTLKALQELSRTHRDTFAIPVLAIGGSNGKTTTKELVAGVLSERYQVLKTEGNLNNHIGVPRMLLQLKPGHEIAVIEIGANHLGEHAQILELVHPTHVLVTNNGLDHLEGFGSPENVRTANAEVYGYARSHDNVTVFVDASQQDLVEDSQGLNVVAYNPSEMNILENEYAAFEYKGEQYFSNLAGSFNAINMLAAVTVGTFFGVPDDRIARALAEYQPTLLRSELVTYRDAEWTVDCYNANPSSMAVAIESFERHAKDSKKGYVLGGMREMGDYSDSEHQKLVDRVAKTDAELVVFVGNEFASCQRPEGAAWFETSEGAKKFLEGQNLAEFKVLLKGSRGIKMELIIER